MPPISSLRSSPAPMILFLSDQATEVTYVERPGGNARSLSITFTACSQRHELVLSFTSDTELMAFCGKVAAAVVTKGTSR